MKNVSTLFLILGMRVCGSVRHMTVCRLPESHLKGRFRRSATNWGYAVGGGVNSQDAPKTTEHQMPLQCTGIGGQPVTAAGRSRRGFFFSYCKDRVSEVRRGVTFWWLRIIVLIGCTYMTQ